MVTSSLPPTVVAAVVLEGVQEVAEATAASTGKGIRRRGIVMVGSGSAGCITNVGGCEFAIGDREDDIMCGSGSGGCGHCSG